MTTYGEPRVWLDQFPLGEPQPFAVDYHGIRYPGEIIRAQSWRPPWGEPLTGDIYFRIVLLLRRPGAGAPRNFSIEDSRIAVCLPGAGLSRQRGRLTEEIATIRETQARYLTQRDSEVDLIESGGGVFEVTIDDRLVFSKKREDRFPEYQEIPRLVGV